MQTKFTGIGEIERFLGIAEKHISYIDRSKTKDIRIPGPKVDHAIIVSLSCAIALEISLNLFISTPILYVDDKRLRTFLGKIVTKYLRLPIPKKLELVAEFAPGMKASKKLISQIADLFAYRNTIAHPMTMHGELVSLVRSGASDPETTPVLFLSGEADNEVRLAKQHFRVTKRFLQQLRFFLPSKRPNKPINIPNHLYFIQRQKAE